MRKSEVREIAEELQKAVNSIRHVSARRQVTSIQGLLGRLLALTEVATKAKPQQLGLGAGKRLTASEDEEDQYGG